LAQSKDYRIHELKRWLEAAFPIEGRVEITYNYRDCGPWYIGTAYHPYGQVQEAGPNLFNHADKRIPRYLIYLNKTRRAGEVVHTLIHEWAHIRVGIDEWPDHGERWAKEYAAIYTNYLDSGNFINWKKSGAVAELTSAESDPRILTDLV
jgi:hypothetical protein